MTRLSRRAFLETALGLLAVSAGTVRMSKAQNLSRTRTVEGKVLDPDGKPQANAIVYLQDEKSQEVKTYITPADGKYQFTQLSMDNDYQLWSKYQGMKSKIKSISSFSSRTNFFFDLELGPSK